jgi:DNA-directed RNA polymerase subunit RPC12/RpoP/ribosomal protein S15P/S13E
MGFVVIIKGFVQIPTTDKFLKVGLSAEKQMAFYLKREFEDAQDILVLNGIRLESNNDATQIDHLIIHQYGLIIIESKHIAGTIEINERGEWQQLGSFKGMPSPIKQAERQAAFLTKYLSNYIPKLRRNRLKDADFDEVPVDVMVAISDTSNITSHSSKDINNVYKAEAIVDKIKATIQNYKKQDNFFNPTWSVLPLKLSKKTMEEISDILLQKNTPSSSQPATNAQTIHSTAHKQFRCQECGSDNINILYGHNYYFKCKECDKNTPIIEKCTKCGQQLKLRKDRNQFYIECKTCGTSRPFFKNTS